MSTDDAPSNRDNLSSVSTILGLALFCLLIATILVRRLMVHRATRRYARHRLLTAATVVGSGSAGGGVGGIGGAGTRRGEDSLEDDEPRTIAIGARAALMKRPILWEQHLSSPFNPSFSEKCTKGAGNSCWDPIQVSVSFVLASPPYSLTSITPSCHITNADVLFILASYPESSRGNPISLGQPTALQLLTPHTTAHFPKPPPNRTLPLRSSLDPPPRRISRAYERFLFHRDHAAPTPSIQNLQIHSALSSPNAPLPPPPTTTSISERESAVPPPDVPSTRESTSYPNQPTSLHSQRISTTVDERHEEQRQSVVEQKNLEPTSPEKAPQEKRPPLEDGVYAHPIHLTFLISMPDPTTTTTTSTSNPNPNWNSPNLPTLSLGTTHPIAHLPSLLINQDDLDSWWDLPAPRNLNPSNTPNFLSTTRNARTLNSSSNLGFARSPNSTAGRTPDFEFQNVNASRLGHAHAISNAHAHSNGHGYDGGVGSGNGDGGGNLSAGQILQLEIARMAADREREMEQERVMSEGVGVVGDGDGAARGRGRGGSTVFAGYSGLVRAAGVRRM